MIPAPGAGVEALKPSAAIAWHKVPQRDDDRRIIAETLQSIPHHNEAIEPTKER